MSTKRGASELLRCLQISPIKHATRALCSRLLNTRAQALDPERIQWVFLGPPGVGKGTYSTRVAVALGVAHIAAGDLVRGEIKQRTPLGQQARFCAVDHVIKLAQDILKVSVNFVQLAIVSIGLPCWYAYDMVDCVVQMQTLVNRGDLLPDDMITKVRHKKALVSSLLGDLKINYESSCYT